MLLLRKRKNSLKKQEKDNFNIPKSIQQVIPIQRIWTDGIFLVGKNKYSQTFKFSDINYAVASKEDKEAMFLEYGELLNSFDSGATTKITIALRRINKKDFEKALDKLSNEAIQQIKDRRYDYDLKGKVIYIGLAHHGKDVMMKWEEKVYI